MTSNDADIVDDAINSIFDDLRHLNHAPFELSAIPVWAQLPMRDIVASELRHSFGIPQARREELLRDATKAKAQMAAKSAYNVTKPSIPTRYF